MGLEADVHESGGWLVGGLEVVGLEARARKQRSVNPGAGKPGGLDVGEKSCLRRLNKPSESVAHIQTDRLGVLSLYFFITGKVHKMHYGAVCCCSCQVSIL
jgi:hypothetical protein